MNNEYMNYVLGFIHTHNSTHMEIHTFWPGRHSRLLLVELDLSSRCRTRTGWMISRQMDRHLWVGIPCHVTLPLPQWKWPSNRESPGKRNCVTGAVTANARIWRLARQISAQLWMYIYKYISLYHSYVVRMTGWYIVNICNNVWLFICWICLRNVFEMVMIRVLRFQQRTSAVVKFSLCRILWLSSCLLSKRADVKMWSDSG